MSSTLQHKHNFHPQKHTPFDHTLLCKAELCTYAFLEVLGAIRADDHVTLGGVRLLLGAFEPWGGP